MTARVSVALTRAELTAIADVVDRALADRYTPAVEALGRVATKTTAALAVLDMRRDRIRDAKPSREYSATPADG